MESSSAVQHHPTEILCQVAASMSWQHPELSVRLPSTSTTWKRALAATTESLGDVDEPLVLRRHVLSASRREAFKRLALENVPLLSSLGSASAIRTKGVLNTMGSPKPRSESVREKIRTMAREIREIPDPFPVVLRGSLDGGALCKVKGNITLGGIDSKQIDPIFSATGVEMLWDTGAYHTVVTLETLPEAFQRYLNDPQHDPYHCDKGFRVQLDMVIEFSQGTWIDLASVAVVVPRDLLPNKFTGILLGQRGFIERIVYRSVPRSILIAKGEAISDEFWGDIVVEEYLDDDENLVIL
jgi:hypothetical protein